MADPFPSVEAALEALQSQEYVAERDIGLAVYSAGRDLRDNLFRGDLVRRFGASNRDAVRLILADSVPEPVKTLGDCEVPVKLHREVVGKAKVKVEPEA